MLLMSCLLYAVHRFVNSAISQSLPHNLKLALEYVEMALFVFLPVTGWLAESWLGRYRAIVVGLILSLVTILTLQAAFVLLQFDWTPIPVFLLIVVGLVIEALGIGSFFTNMLPFALDQMIGASAEQLSAAVQWHCWAFNIGLLIVNVLKCAPIPNQLKYLDILPVIFLTIATLCFSAVLIMDCLYHKWLDTNNKTGNPIKLIFQVLNYARKNKCPRLRSALTYIDEEHPSRLDFGKHKFGGPFTEEEVEDVKTILRLIPVLLPVSGVFFFCECEFSQIPFRAQNCRSIFEHYAISTTASVLIPVYRFIVYPFVHKYIPNLLKMIGAGLILCFVSTVMYTVMTGVQHFSEQSRNITMPDTPQVPLYWILITEYLNGIGSVLAMIFGTEFVMAQTPNRMRGIMMGVVIAMVGWTRHGGNYTITRVFHAFKVSPEDTFYFYLALPPLAMLMLIIFVITAKRYKLRERERHVNIQAIAEEHYERYLDQEEEYMKEIAVMLAGNS